MATTESDSNLNPYAPPVVGETLRPENAPETHVNPAFWPGVCLLLSGITWIGVAFGFLVAPVTYGNSTYSRPVFPADFNDRLFLALCILSGLAITMCAWSMVRGSSYRRSMFGAVFACIPFISPFCIWGIPLGIWALFALSDKRTRRFFERKAELSREN